MDNTEEFRRACEARRVLQMSDEQQAAHYNGCLAKRGPRAIEDLKAEVKIQEAKHLLTLDDKKRADYYQIALDRRGQKAVDELIKEVKKQRRLMRTQEMAL